MTLKPTKLQTFLAKGWPWTTLICGCPILVGLYLASDFYSTNDKYIPAILGGAIGGFVISYLILYSLFHLLAKINGAPFYKGDKVQILTGKFQGHIATVYEEWKDRKQVRVNLGKQAQEEVNDVFSFNEIIRVKQTEKTTEDCTKSNKSP